jgi:hypothetical protein
MVTLSIERKNNIKPSLVLKNSILISSLMMTAIQPQIPILSQIIIPIPLKQMEKYLFAILYPFLLYYF